MIEIVVRDTEVEVGSSADLTRTTRAVATSFDDGHRHPDRLDRFEPRR